MRVLTIRENGLGADHTDVATSLSDVARMHEALGRLEEAEPLFARVGNSGERIGRDHRSTQKFGKRCTSYARNAETG